MTERSKSEFKARTIRLTRAVKRCLHFPPCSAAPTLRGTICPDSRGALSSETANWPGQIEADPKQKMGRPTTTTPGPANTNGVGKTARGRKKKGRRSRDKDL